MIYESLPITPVGHKGSSKHINFASGNNTAVDMNSPQHAMTPYLQMASPASDSGAPPTAIKLSTQKSSSLVQGGNLTNTTLIGVSKT